MRPWVVAAIVLAAGCLGDAPEEAVPPEEQPAEPATRVLLELEATPREARSGGPVLLNATLSNLGDAPAFYRVTCDAEPAVFFTLLTPKGAFIRSVPETDPCPEAGPAELAPQESVQASFTFDGSTEGEADPAASGTYVAMASTQWWADPVSLEEANATVTYRAVDVERFLWLGEGGVEPPVALDVRAEPSTARPGDTVVVNATAVNTGPTSVWYESGCATPVAVDTYVDGRRVASTWPDGACDARVPAELPPGASVSTAVTWTVEAAQEEALTFVARIQYWTDAEASGVPEAVGAGTLVDVAR